MSTKFTPGPWKVFDVRGAIGAQSGRSDVAWTYHLENGLHDTDRSLDENRANAHLIAAAPELYKALEAACDLMAQEDFATLTLVPKLRAALARARGEQ